MKKYGIKKITIFINVVSLLLIGAIFVYIFLNFIEIDDSVSRKSFSGLLAGVVMFMILALEDFKNGVWVSEKGISYKRHLRETATSWIGIHRLEYRSFFNNKKFGKMVIHITGGNMIIDTSFDNYLELWSLIVTKYCAVREAPCIDKELLDLVNMDKDVE